MVVLLILLFVSLLFLLWSRSRRRVHIEPVHQLRRQVSKRLPAPEITRLRLLVARFERETEWSNLIAIADIYQKGGYPRFAPVPHIAQQVYHIATQSTDPTIASLAQARFMESWLQDISAEDIKGRPLPTQYAERACVIARQRILAPPTPRPTPRLQPRQGFRPGLPQGKYLGPISQMPKTCMIIPL